VGGDGDDPGYLIEPHIHDSEENLDDVAVERLLYGAERRERAVEDVILARDRYRSIRGDHTRGIESAATVRLVTMSIAIWTSPAESLYSSWAKGPTVQSPPLV